jgi:hypothetical protein
MIKKILLFLVITIVLFSGAYLLMDFLKSGMDMESHVGYFYIYLYFLIATWAVYFIVVGAVGLAPDKIGYLFLALVFVKLGLFLLIFKATIFGDVGLAKLDKIALFLPLFISMALEAIFILKLLKTPQK